MLGKKGIYLITDESTRLRFTGYSSTDGFLIFDDSTRYFVIDARYYYAAERALKKSDVKVVKGSFDEAADIIRNSGKTELYVDFSKTTMEEGQKLAFLGLKLKDCREEVVEARILKTEAELKLIRRACSIAESSFKAIIPEIKEGVTESYLAALLEAEFKKRGAEKPSFDTIVAFGSNAAVPHHQTGETKLKKNSVVLFDFGCKYKGYCSDITRTIFYGEPDKAFKSAYKAVNAAFDAAFSGIKEGMSGRDADALARSYLKKRGLEKFFTHSLGHGIGVDIHEEPSLSPRGEKQLLSNMVFSIEPGVYIDGKFGIRIENTVAIVNGKVESFVKLGRKLKRIKI
ncbi:MAG: aminopeptidase P family protein [Clostridia bacterium]|nr:aminopeptidase P family protein [Clostridia bacterium]